MNPLDILLQGAASSGGMPDISVILRLLQQQQLLETKAKLQAEDPLRKAQTAKVQASIAPQRSLVDILGGGQDQQPDTSGATYLGAKGDFISSSGPGGKPWSPADQFGYSPEKGLYPINQTPTGSNELIIKSLTPETGTPWFGNVMPEWAAPEDVAAFERLKASPEYAPKTSSETKKSTEGEIDPARLARHAEIVHALTKNGYAPTQASQIADRVVPEVGAIEREQKLETFRQQRNIAKATALAPKGLYLDKEGKPLSSAPLTFGDIPEGSTHYDLTSPQGKLAASIPLLLSHVNQTVEEVAKIAPKGKAALQNWIQAKMREWKNDPAQRALGDMLDPASAMAMGTLYASGGTSTRGGVALAQMFRDSFYSPGNDIPAVKEKLSVALGLMKEIATKQNLHPRYIQELEDLQSKVTSMGGSSKPQQMNSLPDPSKYNGQVIRGSDGSRLLSDGLKWNDITNVEGAIQ